MGFLFRVRLASFFAGAATASVAGFYLLYKDYMLAHDAIRRQVLSFHPSYLLLLIRNDVCAHLVMNCWYENPTFLFLVDFFNPSV